MGFERSSIADLLILLLLRGSRGGVNPPLIDSVLLIQHFLRSRNVRLQT